MHASLHNVIVSITSFARMWASDPSKIPSLEPIQADEVHPYRAAEAKSKKTPRDSTRMRVDNVGVFKGLLRSFVRGE